MAFMNVFIRVGSILRGKEDEFAKEIQNLAENATFNLMAFEDVIDKIRSYIAEVYHTIQNNTIKEICLVVVLC